MKPKLPLNDFTVLFQPPEYKKRERGIYPILKEMLEVNGVMEQIEDVEQVNKEAERLEKQMTEERLQLAECEQMRVHLKDAIKKVEEEQEQLEGARGTLRKAYLEEMKEREEEFEKMREMAQRKRAEKRAAEEREREPDDEESSQCEKGHVERTKKKYEKGGAYKCPDHEKNTARNTARKAVYDG